jgi:hypothetical protein
MIQNSSGHYFSVERSSFISGGLPHSFSILLSPGIVMSGMRFGKKWLRRARKDRIAREQQLRRAGAWRKEPY